MNTRIFSLALMIIAILPVHAQLNAGEVPTGWSAFDPGIDLQLSTEFTVDSASFDVDGDGVNDLRAVLFQGYPAIDAPNACALQILSEGLELCANDAAYNWRPKYYAYGEMLSCAGMFDWRSDSLTYLGDMGGFSAIGPEQMPDTYVAYRKNGVVGWVRLDFVLTGGTQGYPIQLRITEVLITDANTSVGSIGLGIPFTVFPVVNNGQALVINCSSALDRIELLDLTGRTIASYNGSERTIASPGSTGKYFVRAYHTDKSVSTVGFVRH